MDTLIDNNSAALFFQSSVPVVGIVILVPAPLNNGSCPFDCAVFTYFKSFFNNSYRGIVTVLEADSVLAGTHKLSHFYFSKLLGVHSARFFTEDVDIP